MLHDVLLITEKHKKAAHQIVEHINTMTGSKIVIAIGGESGSGKTELGHQVAYLLKNQKTPAKIMSIDNYYKTSPKERNPWRKAHGIDQIGYSEYNWNAINKTLLEFREDAQVAVMPCVDLLTDQEDFLTTSFRGIRFLVIEGLYAIQAEADLRVFIDLTYHDTKKAQIVRGKENFDEWRLQVLEQEHRVVRSLYPLADLIVTPEFEVVPAGDDKQ
jgi:uridine kinase